MKTETIQVTVEGTVQASLSLYIQEDYPDTYDGRMVSASARWF